MTPRVSSACLVALCAASSACTGAPAPSIRDEPRAAAPPRAPEVDEALLKWLELQAVHGDAFGRRVLYTWTTPAQVEEAARTGTLLLKKDGDGKRSIFDETIGTNKGLPTAQIAALAPFERRRFAWANPWATSLGFGAERYGDALVRVVLKKSAIIGRLSPEGGSEVDLIGAQIGEYDLIRQPERLAAVYHVGSTDPTKPETAFREYVLLNESQIEEWSVATPTIRERLELDAAMLHRLARVLAGARRLESSVWAKAVTEGPWLLGARSDDAGRRYEAGLAFLTDRYRPLPDAVEAVARNLARLVPRGPPIVRAPNAAFPYALLGATAAPGAQRPCIHLGSQCVPIGGK